MSTGHRGVHIGPPRFKVAVQSVAWLAKSGSILSSAVIAAQVHSHPTFMRRVMHALADAGIVDSKGGREGGYSLHRTADQITLGDIYAAVATVHAEPEMEGTAEEPADPLGTELLEILHGAEERVIEYLRNYTISDVMSRAEF